jgi:hypothetical protein
MSGQAGSGADNRARCVGAGLVRQSVARGCGPRLWRASLQRRGNGHVLRRRETIQHYGRCGADDA